MTNENLPLVSIVIPCHNYGRYLDESIGSALNQTYPNIEVIVIDDDSTDDTSEAAKRFPVKYFRIKHKGNATPAHAHNVGLTVCKGDFIIFFGADDRLNPLYVERCYNKFVNCQKKEPKIGFVWTGTQEFGDSNEMRLPRVERLAHFWSAYENMGGQVGAMFVPLSVYKVVGGYDESLHGLEDWDWIIRALSKSFIGVSIKEPLHEQRFHGKNLTITTIRVNMEVELWAKYPWMKQYVFARNRFNEIKLFITENNRFRIKVYNRTVHKLFHMPSLTAGPDNCQHVWVNERRIIKKVKGRKILDCGCGKGRWGYLLGKIMLLSALMLSVIILKRLNL
jgi:glycosyltransferase involved in cell wall biosynthesis